MTKSLLEKDYDEYDKQFRKYIKAHDRLIRRVKLTIETQEEQRKAKKDGAVLPDERI